MRRMLGIQARDFRQNMNQIPIFERELPEWIVPISKLATTDTGRLCRIPYRGHRHGCPNYGKSNRCPPNAPHVTDVFDIVRPMYFVYSEFFIPDHARKMKALHPEWSDRQCRCVLYWQGKARKKLRLRVSEAMEILNTDIFTSCPEGMGVNVFATARKHGMILERTKDIRICRHIALAGFKIAR